MNVTVSIVELINVKLIDDTDTQTLEETWRVDLIVTDAFNVSDLVHLREIEAVRIVLVLTLHNI